MLTVAMKSARDWKGFYARERAALGESGLRQLVDHAPPVALPSHGALVFPHTRLAVSGHLVAAVAEAVVESGRDTVLALGALHGAREQDRGLVARARAGDELALRALRRVHGPDTASDAQHWAEEFSLDGFEALLTRAARRRGRPAPRLLPRFPFLVGDRPDDLPGLDELRCLLDAGAALVATADPIHHGHGYGTPPEHCRPREEPTTERWARQSVEEGFAPLARGAYGDFLRHAAEARSDFRDAGPVMAALLREGGREVEAALVDVTLVDYSDVLDAPAPTWVAGALAAFEARPSARLKALDALTGTAARLPQDPGP